MNNYTFGAFISYSHRDLSFGKWLQEKAGDPSPSLLTCGEKDPGDRGSASSGTRPIWPARDCRTRSVQELRDGRYLIVLCSPSSAASSWISEEVLYFISLGRIDRIIPFIIDGEPLSDTPALECYPEGLRSLEDFTLLGANIQEIGKNAAFLKLVSILLDVRFGRLVDREKQRKRREDPHDPGRLCGHCRHWRDPSVAQCRDLPGEQTAQL